MATAIEFDECPEKKPYLPHRTAIKRTLSAISSAPHGLGLAKPLLRG